MFPEARILSRTFHHLFCSSQQASRRLQISGIQAPVSYKKEFRLFSTKLNLEMSAVDLAQAMLVPEDSLNDAIQINENPPQSSSSAGVEPLPSLPSSSYNVTKGQGCPYMNNFVPRKQKKVAILLGYSGDGYNGMQWNPEVVTIESTLFTAMAKLNLIPHDWNENLQQLNFQRCARTDKGVSAAAQVVSIPLPNANVNPEVIEQINAELPPSIRLFGLKKVTQGFNCKTWCSGRTYMYMMPTFGFAPLEEVINYDYRINPDRLVEVRGLLSRYLGTNNFHNFTVGVKAWQDTAKRYMKEISCGEPFVSEGIEFVVIRILGQSFMMHQIRKMVGLVIAVMRGDLEKNIFDTVYGPQKVDIPKAPGLGLHLDSVHFELYDKKFGKDGMHEALVWPHCHEAVEKFKMEQIFPSIVRGEKEQNSMLEWLAHLPNHLFGRREPGQEEGKTHSALGKAEYHLTKHREREAELSDCEAAGSDGDGQKSARKKQKPFEI